MEKEGIDVKQIKLIYLGKQLCVRARARALHTARRLGARSRGSRRRAPSTARCP